MDRQLLKWLSKGLQFVFALVVMYVVGMFVYTQWQELSRIEFTLKPLLFIIALVILLLFYLLYAFTWIRIVRWFKGSHLNFPTIKLVRIFFLSLITRYLPAGKIVNVGSRIELFKREGGRRLIAAKSILGEQFYLITCALVFAWITILLIPGIRLPEEINPYRILLLLGGGVLLIFVFYADLLYSKIAEETNFDKMRELDVNITWSQRLELLIRYLVINCIQGSAAFLFIFSVYQDTAVSHELFFYTVAAYPVSRFVGQMVVFLPGGIGVREGVFALALSPYLPVPLVLLAGTVMRLSSVVLEILIILITFLIDRSERVWESLSG